VRVIEVSCEKDRQKSIPAMIARVDFVFLGGRSEIVRNKAHRNLE